MNSSITPITIAVIIGTTRTQRESHKPAQYIAEFGTTVDGVQTVLVDPNEFSFDGDGNDPEGKNPRYTEIVDKADAFFIVVPEYNHSFSGSLKRMLDSELALYNHKPVAFAGVSNGSWGGVRGVEALVGAVRELGLVAMSWDIYFPRVQELFEPESGSLKPEYVSRYAINLQKLYTELVWFARLLKTAKE